MGDCPICKRQTCGHFAFGEDIRGYTGAEFVLWAFGMHIETNPPQSAKPFSDMDKDITKILGKHFVIVDGKGYSKSPDRAVRNAKTDVAKYLRTLGYTVP
jgi:hypothetical protein